MSDIGQKTLPKSQRRSSRLRVKDDLFHPVCENTIGSTKNKREDSDNSTISPQFIFSAMRSSKSVSEYFIPDIVSENPKRKPFGSSSFVGISAKKRRIHPTPDECRLVVSHLSLLHPYVVQKNHERRQRWNQNFESGEKEAGYPITDAIVSTILSQNTTDANSKRAFVNLKEEFPSWDDVLAPPSGGIPEDTHVQQQITRIESAIKVAGLAPKRAPWIHNMLSTARDERSVRDPSRAKHMEYVRPLSDEEIRSELLRFPGLGPKTVSCVLLFALHRPDFPVDTHVLRISKAMGWVSTSSSREKAYEHLNGTVPNDCKLDLHCLLVEHGKVCHSCASNGRPQFPPLNGKIDCPLRRGVTAKAKMKPPLVISADPKVC